MSLFQNHYALIEEVWNQPIFSPTIVNRYKQAQSTPQNTSQNTPIVTNAEPETIRRILNESYKTRGIAGVKPYLDDAIIRDLKSEGLQVSRGTGLLEINLSKEDYIYVLLGLFAILFALDS